VVERTLFDGDDSPAAMYLKGLATPLRNNIPNPMNDSVCEAIRYLRASIVVSRFELVKGEDIDAGKEGHPAWNVFMAPATTYHLALQKWVSKVRRTAFVTKKNGAGITKTIYSCSICLSEGHPGRMCAFTKLPGWVMGTPQLS
jgi:hypothetical protein